MMNKNKEQAKYQQATRILKESLGAIVRTEPEEIYPTSFDGMRLAFSHEATIKISKEEQVGQVLHLANEFRVPVTTRGAGTTLTGSASPAHGGWVLELSALRECRILPLQRMAEVQAGVVLQDLQEQAEAKNLFYPPDPSSLKYCTIGGNIACNAGGMRCVKYGVTRDYIYALKGYLPTGEPVSWGRNLKKFACGYNIRDLWIGSEGTLGVVTGATLRLVPRPECRWNMILAFPDEYRALVAVEDIFACGLQPAIIEFLDRASVQGAERASGRAMFPGHPGSSLLLLQMDGSVDEVLSRKEMVEQWAAKNTPNWQAAGTEEEADKIWAIRRLCSSAMFELGDSKLNEDVAVPLDKQIALIEKVDELRRRHQVAIASFGHAGDGNLHVNIMHHKADFDECQRARKAVGELMEFVVSVGGTISGEHGIGLAKTPFFRLQHSPEEIAVMKRIKHALDPNGILNPGKLFEPFEVWNRKKEDYSLPWDHRS